MRGQASERGQRDQRHGQQQERAPETLESVVQEGLKAINDVNPTLAQDLGAALSAANLPDGARGILAVKPILENALTFAKANKSFDETVASADSHVFPTSEIISQLSASLTSAKNAQVDAQRRFGEAVTALGNSSPTIRIASLDNIDSRFASSITASQTNMDRVTKRIQDDYNLVNGGPASAPAIQELLAEGLTTAAPITIGTVRAPSGREVTLELVKEEGIALARFRMKEPGAGGSSTEIDFKMDYGKLLRDVTAADQDAQLTELEATRMRVQSRLHVLLTNFQAALDPANPAAPKLAEDWSKDTGFGLLSSDMGKEILAVGGKITALRNGGFISQNITNLDLSGAELKNFSIIDCHAHGLNLSAAKISDGSKIDDNYLHNADLSRITFVGNDCSFCDNDMHGRRGSLAGADLAGTPCQRNNLLGVDMSGIKADSLNNALAAEKGGLPWISRKAQARADFKDQFNDTYFTPAQLGADSVTRGIFDTNSSKIGSSTEIASKLGDLSYKDTLEILTTSPFISVVETTLPGAAAPVRHIDSGKDDKRGILRDGVLVRALSRDGLSGQSVHLERDMQQGYFDADGTPRRMGNLELIDSLLEVASQNRKGWSVATARKGMTPMASDVRRI